MDTAPAHQHVIPRLQGIPLALDGVACPPRQQNDDLMKGVVMIGDLLMIPIGQMKQPERLVEIAALFIL